jgi:hypothetical protein
MSEITISTTVKPYILKWVTQQYGAPARFPKQHYINYLIGELIAKPPKDYIFKPTNDNLIIQLPYFTGKDIRSYNYLSQNSKKELARSIRQLFYYTMFDEVQKITLKLHTNKGSAIRIFMEKYDIDEEHFETLKKKEYRKRQKHPKKSSFNR